jgi:hypothetical protein
MVCFAISTVLSPTFVNCVDEGDNYMTYSMWQSFLRGIWFSACEAVPSSVWISKVNYCVCNRLKLAPVLK